MRGFGDYIDDETASALKARDYKDATDLIAYDMKQHHNPQPTDTFSLTASNCKFVRGDTPLIAFPAEMSGTQAASTPEMSPTLSVGHTTAVAYGIPGNWIGRKPENGGNSTTPMYEMSPNLTSADKHGVSRDMKVRRLTPIETERLQGFPDNYTQIAWRNKDADDCPDGPRYKAMGNSMAVPVMRWIGERIQMVEDMSQ